MTTKLNLLLVATALCASQIIAPYSQAQTASPSAGLKEIAEFAASICPAPAASSNSSTADASIDVKAKLGTLAKKLTDLGISGAAKISSTATNGVLQKDLAGALKDVGACRVKAVELVRDAVFGKRVGTLYGYCPADRYETIAKRNDFGILDSAYQQFLENKPRLEPPVHPSCEKGLRLASKIAEDSLSLKVNRSKNPGSPLSAYDEGLVAQIGNTRKELSATIEHIKAELGRFGS